MYSVGVVAVELFLPFGTEMERAHTLGELKQEQVPDTLTENWPDLAKHIRLLTSSDPSMRPSASQLLRSDLFSTKDTVRVFLNNIPTENNKINVKKLLSQFGDTNDSSRLFGGIWHRCT